MHNFSKEEVHVIKESVNKLVKALAPLADRYPALRGDSHDTTAISDSKNYEPLLKELQKVMPEIAGSYFKLTSDEQTLIHAFYDPANFIDASTKLVPKLIAHYQKHGSEGLTRSRGILAILSEIASQSGTLLFQTFKNPNPDKSSDLVGSGIIASLHGSIQSAIIKALPASAQSQK